MLLNTYSSSGMAPSSTYNPKLLKYNTDVIKQPDDVVKQAHKMLRALKK